jgi:hypothetical protein
MIFYKKKKIFLHSRKENYEKETKYKLLFLFFNSFHSKI